MDGRNSEEITVDKRILNWMKENQHLMTASILIGLLLTPFLWPFFLAIIYNALSLAVPIFLILIGIKMPWKNAREGSGKETAQERSKNSEMDAEKERGKTYEQRENIVAPGKYQAAGNTAKPAQKEKKDFGTNAGRNQVRKSEMERGTRPGSGEKSKLNKTATEHLQTNTMQSEDDEAKKALAWYTADGKERIMKMIEKMDKEGYQGLSIRNDGMCSVKAKDGYRRVGALRNFPRNRMEVLAKVLQASGIPSAKVKGKYLCLFWKPGNGKGVLF